MANIRISGFVNEGGLVGNKTPRNTDALIANAPLQPTTNQSLDLGSSSLQWNNLHTKNAVVYGKTTTNDIVPSSDSVYSLGDPNIAVWSNIFSINGNFQVVSMMNNGGDPTPSEGFGYIYTKTNDGTDEVFVQDSRGNVTQISPHNEDNEWHYFSRNVKTGKVVRINMEKMIRKLEEITGESFIEEWLEE